MSGNAFHFSAKDLPPLPVIGKRGEKDVSKPVAHIMTSTGWCTPSFVMIPVPSTRAMPSRIVLTLSSVRASR